MAGFAGISVDEITIRRARRGDADAHGALYRVFAPPVYTLALRLLGSPALAEDMLQETFLEIMRSLPRYRGEATLATWIRRIAVSKCLMHLRSAWHQRAEDIPADAELGDGEPPVAERLGLTMDLETALSMLPVASRVVVWLHDVEGYTHREIALAMEKTESYSKSQLSRAHRKLRQTLAEQIESDNPVAADTVPGGCI